MPHCLSTVITSHLVGKFGQLRRSSGRSIQVLDDDSLLCIFYFCLPVLSDEREDYDRFILRGGHWDRERWWYKLAQVCRRWRHLILGSAFRFRLSLLCTYGTPVADMLAHSPPLPLIIDHLDKGHPITAEDEERITLALRHRERVRHIRLRMPVVNLQRIIEAMHGEFPILESLCVAPTPKHAASGTNLALPESFRAPHLRHLLLGNAVCTMGSSLLTPVVGLVRLFLDNIPLAAYFHPSDLLRQLSLMSQLETLSVSFRSPVPSRDVERQLLRTPVTTRVILPTLRWFLFGGVSEYLEALLPWMTAPLLERLRIRFFNQLTFSIPHVLQFIGTMEDLRFSSVWLLFRNEAVIVKVYPHEGATMKALSMEVRCRHVDWQVASAAEIMFALRTVLSSVEDLVLQYDRRPTSPMWHSEVDRGQWRELLGSSSGVKRLFVDDGLVGEVSRAVQMDDGESPVELLPELKELGYITSRRAGAGEDAAFAAFADARRNAGHPVTLDRSVRPKS